MYPIVVKSDFTIDLEIMYALQEIRKSKWRLKKEHKKLAENSSKRD